MIGHCDRSESVCGMLAFKESFWCSHKTGLNKKPLTFTVWNTFYRNLLVTYKQNHGLIVVPTLLYSSPGSTLNFLKWLTSSCCDHLSQFHQFPFYNPSPDIASPTLWCTVASSWHVMVSGKTLNFCQSVWKCNQWERGKGKVLHWWHKRLCFGSAVQKGYINFN